jgi:uncharacterized membrane protein YcfT
MYAIDATILHARVGRVDWVDYAKGICIIMVVMMHVTHDYGAAAGSEGWLHHVVTFARPFRMPDFFLLSGIFLSLTINSPLREYIDKNCAHFIYFYLIWLTIQLGITESKLLLTDPAGFMSMFLLAWIEPVNTLWFVHMLAIFYLVTRWLRYAPGLLVFLLAAGLQTAFRLGWIDTEWSILDRFFDSYVYFYIGYAAAPWIFSFAKQIPSWRRAAVAGLILWAAVNAAFTFTNTDAAPGISLVLGIMGAAAIVAIGSLLASQPGWNWLKYCGANSIVIYISFFLPMKIALSVLASTGVIADVGTATLLITVFVIVTPLIFHLMIQETWLAFLYKRPKVCKITAYQPQSIKIR